MRFVATMSYVGTSYCGFQRQPGLNSVQAVFEDALRRLTREAVVICASGRTDAGVHALGQTVHFDLQKRAWSPRELLHGVNRYLPPTISISRVQAVAPTFHARLSAKRKRYGYYLLMSPVPLAPWSAYCHRIDHALDAPAMREALESLIGEGDFRAFRGRKARPGDTRRHIFRARLQIKKLPFPWGLASGSTPELWKIELVGNGFLKQMVRGIVGTLIEVGQSKRPVGTFKDLLTSGRRADCGPTAPAQGLWLEQVQYARHRRPAP